MTSLSSDEDGLDEWMNIIGVVYVPQDTLRKDRDNVQPCDAAGYFKRHILLWLLLKTS